MLAHEMRLTAPLPEGRGFLGLRRDRLNISAGFRG